MAKATRKQQVPPDKPFLDTTPYWAGKDDFVTDATENAAVTQHVAIINGTTIRYTATAGHLVTNDMSSARPAARIFYVAFTENDGPASRPVTFFYNWSGGRVQKEAAYEALIAGLARGAT